MENDYLVTATDMSEPALALAKQKSQNINSIKSDMNVDFPFDDNMFDGATSVWANRFIADSNHFLSETRRVLKPGGTLVWPIFAAENIAWKLNTNWKQNTSTEQLAADAVEIGYTNVHEIKANYLHRFSNRNIPLRSIAGYVIATK